MAVFRFDDISREMYLSGYYPGIAIQTILDNMAFAVDTTRAVEVTPPTELELKILRKKCDLHLIL